MTEIEATAAQALAEKVQRQEHFIARLLAELERTRDLSIRRVLGQLRLRGAVLLYVGSDVPKLLRDIDEVFPGQDASRDVSNYLFVLDNAPVPVAVREALREATNHGMNRW